MSQEISELIQILKSDPGTRILGDDPIESAITKFKNFGTSAVKPLLDAMKECSGHPLGSIISALGETGDASVVESILPYLNNEEDMVRYHTAETLGKIGEEKMRGPLIKALQDESWLVRLNSARALGKIGHKDAVAPLLEVIKNKDSEVRGAIEALGELGDIRAVDALVNVAISNEEEINREEAVKAIEKIDKTALKRVEKGLEDKEIPILSGATHLYDAIHSGMKYTEENPIRMKGTDAIVYLETNSYRDNYDCWILSIPTGSPVRENRTFVLDSEKNPDAMVTKLLKEAPKWRLGTIPEGKLFTLMKSEWVFDYNNPIIIGDVAYVYYDDYDKEWYLTIRVSEVGGKSVELAKIAPIDENIDKAVIDTIAAVGLSMI